MNQVIDGKIVEMKFDNADFERNVAQSMSTLEKLKQALNFDSAKSLESVGKASKNFSMDGVGSAVEAVQAKFSALQVIGMTALSELTKSVMHFGSNIISSVIEPIKTGGMNRAMNIEQAKFQLEGLGVAWKDIEADINYGVKDTAYGLDVAAKAASQLTASGVQMGDEMKSALRGISGVASMTSSSYEEISPIFTTIAGQGKVMTMQLRQLESRGLNAAATLADFLGTTEAEVRQMVTDGKIDFQTFADAMDSAFGAHAKDANKTFTGAMSNVRAALSRVGANFATPYMENMRKIAVAGIEVINSFNKAMGPIYEDVSAIMERLQIGITNFLGSSGLNEGIVSLVNAVRNAFYALLLVVEPIKQAFRDIFPKDAMRDFSQKFRDTAKAIEEFTSKMVLSEENSQRLRDTFKGLFAVIDIIKMAFKGLFDAIKPYTGTLGDILSNLLDFTAGIGRYLTSLRDSIRENDTFGRAFKTIADTIANAGTIIKNAFDKIVNAIKTFKANHIDDKDFSGITNFIDGIKEKLPSFSSVSEVLGSVFNKIKTAIGNFIPYFKAGVKLIAETIGTLLNGFASAFKGTGNDPFTAFLNMFNASTIGTMAVALAQALAQVTKQVKNMGGLSPILIEIKNTFKTIQADLKADILTKLAKAIAIFAASILVLSLIDAGRLTQSLIGVEILIETLKGFVAFIDTISTGSFKDVAKFTAIGGALTSLATAVLVLSVAVRVMASLDLISLAKGLTATIVLIEVLAATAKSLASTEGQVMKGAAAMIALAVGVRILASAVEAMSDLTWEELVKGLGATIVLLGTLAGVMKLLDGVKVSGVATAIIAMSVALLILTQSVKQLGEIPFEQLVQGMAAAVIGMTSMGLVLTMLGTLADGGTLVAGAVALIALSASLLMLTSAVRQLGEIPFEQLVQGLASAVIGMTTMSLVLVMLTTLSTSGELLAAAAAMLIMSESINILAKAIKIIGGMDIEDLIKAGVTIVALVGGLAAAAALLTPLLGPMAALAGIITLLGVGVLALGVGVTALSVGLSALATSCTVVVANLGAILTIVAALIPAIATALANGIVQFIVVIGQGAAQIVDAVVALGQSILQGITALLPDIFNLVLTFLIQLIEAIVVLVPRLVEAGMRLIIGLMEGITRQMPALIAAGNNLLITFINSLAEGIRRDTPRLITAVDNLMNALLDAGKQWFSHFVEQGGDIVKKLVEGIKGLIDTAKSAGSDLVEKAKEGIKQKIESVIQLGRDFVDGFVKGIKEAPGKIIDAAKGMVTTAIETVRQTQNSNSPAKVTEELGTDFEKGYELGIKNGNNSVKQASQTLANSALDPLRAASKEAPGLFNTISAYAERYGVITKKSTNATEELRREQIEARKAANSSKEATDSLTKSTESYAKAATGAGKAAKEEKTFLESITDTISGQLDMFSKFEMKTEMTAQQMLENMKSNLDGFASWSAELAQLAERGIDQSLYQKLAEMGPKSYEQVHAFSQMTDEQLQQANQMWQQSITLPESVAGIVGQGYDRAGKGAVDGLTGALKAGESTVKSEGAAVGQAAVDGVTSAEGLDEHSPSRKTYLAGENAIAGLNEGMKGMKSFVVGTATAIARFIVDAMQSGLAPAYFVNIGTNAISGLISGMEAQKQPAYDEAYGIGENVMLGMKQGIEDNEWRPLERARNVAQQIIEIIAQASQVHSPSRATMRIGAFIAEGLAIGIENGADRVYNSAERVATLAEDGIESTAGRIQDFLIDNLDFNPVITPVLDLSYMREQLSSVNDMFADRTLSAAYAGQNGGIYAPGSNPSITFTQNNYSPKALSRYEIYRNTRNQISMLKGAMA